MFATVAEGNYPYALVCAAVTIMGLLFKSTFNSDYDLPPNVALPEGPVQLVT